MNSEVQSVGISAEDRQAMCDVFERLLLEKYDDVQLRSSVISEAGFDIGLWNEMAELGLLGVLIDSDFGGFEGSMREVGAFMEIAGKFLFTSPYVSSCVIAPTLLRSGIKDESTQELLGEIASGQSIVIPLGFEAQNAPEMEKTNLSAELHNDAWLINGTVELAQFVGAADKLIMVAENSNKSSVFVCETGEAGIAIDSLPTNDQTLRLSNLKFKNVRAQLLFNIEYEELQIALDSAVVATAGEQVGAARAVFDQTVDYLKTRFQFGQPIGSFQALKHMVADLYIELESMTSVARAASAAVAEDAPNKETLTSLAAFTCKDGFRHIAAESIQLHGGIAYTIEHFAHLYWRRAQSSLWLYGSSDDSRERYLANLEKSL